MVKNLYKPVSVLCFSVIISACSIPNMRMASESDFTPAVNENNQAQKALVIPIDVRLILEERKKERLAAEIDAQNYIPPEGFSASTKGYEYTIGYQDVLNIIVWDYNSLTNTSTNLINSDRLKTSGFTVDANGEIFYPYVGYVKVAGLTVAQARNLIAKKLSKYLKDPQLTLQIISFNSQRINVMGAVKQPTMIPVSNVPTTVLDAVNAAGGPIRCGNALSNATQANGNTAQQICADTTNIVVKKDGIETLVDIDKLKAADGSSTNWVLSEGSIVFVPTNRYLIYVLGDVRKPGAFNMVNGKMSLKQAIVAAQGVTVGSAPAYTYVIRGYESKPRVYSIDIQSPDALILAGQFELRTDDVVFVSPSALETVGQVLGYAAPLTSLAISTASLGVSISALNR